MAYPKLPGRPLSTARRIDSPGKWRLGEFLATLLTELTLVPTRSLLRIGAKPGTPRAWAERFRRLENQFEQVGLSRISSDTRKEVHQSFQRFYESLRTSSFRPVAAHLDLGVFNGLWDSKSNRPTGVVDWEDLCVGDPAFDLRGMADLAPARLKALTEARVGQRDSTFGTRLRFYRRLVPLHDFIFSAEAHRWEMTRKSAASVQAIFG